MGYYTKEDLADDVEVDERFDRLPDAEALERTVENVRDRNMSVQVVDDAAEAREALRARIPDGATVYDGHSTTLEEVGFTDVLEGADGFEYLGHTVRDIDDDDRRARARREAMAADVFFDSPNAIAETGELVAANAGGSGLGAWPYAAGTLVLASGTNKIVPTLEDAIDRVREFALPFEDARARRVYDAESLVGKLLTLEYERATDRVHLLLVDDRLGF